VEEWCDQLQISIAMETKIVLLMNVRQWKNEKVLKVPLVLHVELLIPCTLHMENRVGEKISTMVLRKGLELWSRSSLKKETLNRWRLSLNSKNWELCIHQHTGLYPMRGEIMQK
jgi:hypothetical protein